MRRLLPIVIFLFSAAIALGNCPLSFKGDTRAGIGLCVIPIAGDATPSQQYNADLLLTPASVMKAVTTAAAITRHGGTYRWLTTVRTTGSVSGGTLHGNVLIDGCGDPSLGSKQFADSLPNFVSAIASALSSAGISAVEGEVLSANSWPDQGPIPSWELEDIPGIDGAGFYTLNWADNLFTLSLPALKATPTIPGLEVEWKKEKEPLRFWRNPGSRQLTVYGAIPAKQKGASLRCSMPNPPAALCAAVASRVGARGKKISPTAESKTIVRYYSPQLRSVARSMMVRSDNQMAEATLRLLAPGQTRKQAIATERTILTDLGLDISGMRIADGSGLSRHNAVSPRQLAELLRLMAGDTDYLSTFARVGVDGTVRNFLKGVPGRENFLLKSGSMTGVVCYCGYLMDPQTKRPTHAIAVMINNAPESSLARAAIAAWLATLTK